MSADFTSFVDSLDPAQKRQLAEILVSRQPQLQIALADLTTTASFAFAELDWTRHAIQLLTVPPAVARSRAPR